MLSYVGELFKGNLDKSLSYLANDVKVAVSNGEKTVRTFPPGKAAARAMYVSMTNSGALAVNYLSCRPEASRARCDLILEGAGAERDFTLRFEADGGPVTRILVWENHERVED